MGGKKNLQDGRHNEEEGEDQEQWHEETENPCQVVAGEVILVICIRISYFYLYVLGMGRGCF